MDRFEQIEDLFQRAFGLSTDERAAFLERATNGDAALYQEVDGLLREARRASETPLWDSGALAVEAYCDQQQLANGRRPAELGHYRLGERIGAGGMGVVYKAVRTEEDIPQTVAIKILQAHPEDHLALARFVRERRILAGLEHPNIARLLDGGTTPEGLPFLAMEYVNGVDLTRYLAQAKPSLPAILALFTKICSAISYTHQNLIAHRDLKPANILVTSSGEPKVLDFGIATLFDRPAFTRAGEAALTPRYASPEQVRGELAGPASDIYSLGVLLYEMLSGRLPYPSTAGPLALARAITDEPPVPLRPRDFNPDQDLELIIQMALRKEPARRYASVEHFSADIAAYLGGYPVSARPDTRAYRAWKFVTRNKVWVGAIATTVLAIAGGAGAALHEARVANRRAEDVRKLAESMMIDANDSITLLPGSTTARHQLLTRGVRFLDELVTTMGGERRSALGIADGYQKFALLQGLSQINVGDRAGALETERKAEALLRPLVERAPRDLELGSRLVAVYSGLATLMMASGDVDRAAEYARKELDLARRLSALSPANLDLHSAVADAYETWGDVNGNPLNNSLGDAETAVASYQSAAAIVEGLVQADPAQVDRKQGLAGIHTRLGKVHAWAHGDPAAALAEFSTAASLSEWIRANSAPNPWREMNVAIRDTNLVEPLLALNRAGEARRRADQAMEILQAILKSDPQIISVRRELAMAFRSRGQVEAAGGNQRSAIEWYERALGLFRELIGLQRDYAADLGLRSLWKSLADAQLKAGNYPGALQSAGEQLRFDERLLAISPRNASANENQAVASEQSGDAERLSGNVREARVWYQKALGILRGQEASARLSRLSARAISRLGGQIAACDRTLLSRQ